MLGRDDQEAVDALRQDWELVQALLPPGWQEQARTLGAFRRARAIPDAATLMRLMMTHLVHGCALRQTAAQAALAGIATVSDVAILKRLRNCAAWFEWMCQRLRQTWMPEALQPSGASCWSGRCIRLLDGTMVSEPGHSGSKWRLHYGVQYPSLRSDEVIVSASSEGETLRRFTFKAGDIAVVDRGFAHPAGVAHVQRAGADVIVRINLVGLPLYDAAGQRIDVLAHARTLQVGQCGAWDVYVQHGRERMAARLCAVKKTPEHSARARQRVRRESQRNGSAVQPQTLEAADYVLIVTTLGWDFDAEQVMQLYRARWQIELVFKRLKSLAELGHLKKHDSAAAQAWLQGKLLVALLVDALLANTERFSPWGFKILHTQTPVQLA